VNAQDLRCGRDFDLRSHCAVVLADGEAADFADQLHRPGLGDDALERLTARAAVNVSSR